MTTIAAHEIKVGDTVIDATEVVHVFISTSTGTVSATVKNSAGVERVVQWEWDDEIRIERKS